MSARAKNLAILGPGLLGGSVALAARQADSINRVNVWARRDSAAETVRDLAIADLASSDLAEVVAEADLIVLATPVGTMPDLVRQLLELPLADGVIITDLGSVKGTVVTTIDSLLESRPEIRFVGSHPMAGKERAGIEHATADLFQGAACVLTPGASSCDESVEAVALFWQQLGCRTLQMDAGEHDSAVAKVSHLPHLAASLVAATALDADPQVGEIAGAGLRDTTRVAAGPPAMWAEILIENRAAVVPAIEDLAARLEQAKDLISNAEQAQLAELLERAKQLRDDLGAADSF